MIFIDTGAWIALQDKKENKMRFIKICLIILLCCTLFSVPAPAKSPNTVKKISIREFDKLMMAKGPMIVSFMASWCMPCRKELPFLGRLGKKYKDSGLKIIGLSLDAKNPDRMQKLVDDLKIDFPIYWAGEAAIKAYKIRAIPLLYFVRNGMVEEKLKGQYPEKLLEKKIEAFLAR